MHSSLCAKLPHGLGLPTRKRSPWCPLGVNLFGWLFYLLCLGLPLQWIEDIGQCSINCLLLMVTLPTLVRLHSQSTDSICSQQQDQCSLVSSVGSASDKQVDNRADLLLFLVVVLQLLQAPRLSPNRLPRKQCCSPEQTTAATARKQWWSPQLVGTAQQNLRLLRLTQWCCSSCCSRTAGQ